MKPWMGYRCYWHGNEDCEHQKAVPKASAVPKLLDTDEAARKWLDSIDLRTLPDIDIGFS